MAKVKMGSDGMLFFHNEDDRNVSIHRDSEYLIFSCPACDERHMVPVKGAHGWKWNGDINAPTLSPSIKVSSILYGPEKLPFSKYDGPFPCESTPSVCHSFVVEGKIQFCSDCTHLLAGQTVELPDII